jgi:predicted regulator of Ras-like GTPase activity (Roadblock/LC7/MglB family)
MFGKIAKLFKRSAGKQSERPAPLAPTAMPEHQPLGRPKYAVPGMDLAVEEEPQAASQRTVVRAGSSDSIVVPFSSILQLVPKELHGKASAGGGSVTYQLPKSVAMEQLSRGAVKVAFGDLRRAAPVGFFAGGSSQDSRLVDLPLREILNQISPEAFARRPALNRIRVPDEVNDLFGSKGERLTELRVMDKSEVKPTAPMGRQPAKAEPEVPPAAPSRVPEAPAAPIRVAPTLAQQLQAPPAKPLSGFQGAPKPPAPPRAPVTPRLPTPASVAPAAPPSMSAVPKVPVAPAAKPVAPLPATTSPLPPNAIKFPTFPQATAPAAASQPAAESSQSGGALTVSIGTISQKWPEAILAVVQQLGVTDLEIPSSLIEAALKSGRIEFQWQQVVAWLRPAPDGDVALDQAGTVLELPLSVVAPLYLQQSRYKAKKSSVPGGIPDLFSNKGDKLDQTQFAQEVQAAEAAEEEEQEEAEAAPVVKAPPRPAAPAAPAHAPAPAAVPAFIPDPTRAKSLAELFAEPNKKNWTPNEIVHKTITMRGIIGALIALQDGLLVAGSMPQPWKTETIAAFIPQIFGRLTQYTKELQMGEVKTVSFGVDGGTLQIFNAGIIYFGALGKPGTALPVEDLTLIASELSRHTK